MLVCERLPYVSIAELAKPLLRLAGLRIDPAAWSSTRPQTYTRLSLVRVADGTERAVTGLPLPCSIERIRWAPAGAHFALAVQSERGLSLWVVEAGSASARLLVDARLNGVLGAPFVWEPGSESLLCLVVPQGRSEPPPPPRVPEGPVIQETTGRPAPARTYQDLLQSAHDEALFEHYAASELCRVTLNGETATLTRPALYSRAVPSPSGAHILVNEVHRPFSYLVPWPRFAHTYRILDRQGAPVYTVARLPLAEEVPIGFDAVPEGPRQVTWRADAPDSLIWVEAADRGDPRFETDERDKLYTLSAPFTASPQLLMTLQYRFAGVQCGDDQIMLVHERWWRTRRARTWRIAPAAPEKGAELIFDRSFEDRYNDPGSFVMRATPGGSYVLLRSRDGRSLFLAGSGASPEGDRPFVDRFDLASKQVTRLWQSQGPYYARPIQLLDPDLGLLLLSRESVTEPPNYYVRDLTTGTERRLTHFEHPTPQLASVYKELIRYQRDDGVELTATLYLPPGKTPADGPFPLLMWAYPREYKSADAAGQVRESPYRFVRLSWGSPLYMLMAGYAVLDGPAMPIIGEGDREANDTYVEQLTASAKAAVDEMVRRGIARPDRIAVGGHSYGGFMTANLLAHTDLFCAGIARSGAYNRTLTPFGFQSEERTLWEAPHVYFAMSAFMHAHQIKAPLLLIHGDADDNAGTFPLQSERLYHALKGLGGTARLVLLPHESHHYRARESVMHMLWEMYMWLERYVKRA